MPKFQQSEVKITSFGVGTLQLNYKYNSVKYKKKIHVNTTYIHYLVSVGVCQLTEIRFFVCWLTEKV